MERVGFAELRELGMTKLVILPEQSQFDHNRSRFDRTDAVSLRIEWLTRPTSSDKWKAPVSLVFTREAIISTSDVRMTLLISVFCSSVTAANDQRYWDCECGLSLCLCP